MYTGARVFELRIHLLCAFSMCCAKVGFQVFENVNQLVSTQGKLHEYPYEVRSFSVLTNQISYLEKLILKCVDPV